MSQKYQALRVQSRLGVFQICPERSRTCLHFSPKKPYRCSCIAILCCPYIFTLQAWSLPNYQQARCFETSPISTQRVQAKFTKWLFSKLKNKLVKASYNSFRSGTLFFFLPVVLLPWTLNRFAVFFHGSGPGQPGSFFFGEGLGSFGMFPGFPNPPVKQRALQHGTLKNHRNLEAFIYMTLFLVT